VCPAHEPASYALRPDVIGAGSSVECPCEAEGVRVSADSQVVVTLFPDVAAATKREASSSLNDLADIIRRQSGSAKSRLPLLKLARFGDQLSMKGCLRHDFNVVAITGVEGDYDGEAIPFDTAVETVRKANLEAVVYTSPSHAPERPRWRVLAPTSRELPPAERERLVARVNGLFGGALGGESFTLSQAYYFGAVNSSAAHRVEVVGGTTIDLLDALDANAAGKANGSAQRGQGDVGGRFDADALKAAIVTGESYHVPATRLIGKWAQQGISLLEAQRRIKSIFDEVPEAECGERWRMRYADLGRIVLDIYGKEAGKEGFGERPRAAGSEEARWLRPLSTDEFLALDIPPRGIILDPWLPTKGLAMIYSRRGVGKTLLGLGIAYAVASGGTLLGWSAPQPRRVLYLDGEMPAATMQERLKAIVAGFDRKPPLPDYLRLLSADITEGGLPDLASARGEAAIDAVIDDAEVIILDNLSTLVRSGKENEGESWLPIQGWALAHRRAGRSVLVIHHAGKSGQQRGTSRREDVLDTVINLSQPADYGADQGARFEVHFEKARGLFGDSVRPFEARYQEHDGAADWTRTETGDPDLARVVGALSDGLSIRKAGDALGLDKSKVQRLKHKAVKQGLIDG
jgi:hypothetical protein